MTFNKNKKGQVGTFLPYILVGIVVLLVFAVVVVPIAYVGDETFDELKKTEHFGQSNESAKRISQVQSLMTPAFDQLVFVILIVIILGSFIIAIFTNYHPVVIGVFIIALIILVILAGLFANVYDEVTDTEDLQDKSQEFTFTNAIMGKQLPVMIGFVGVISIIVLLAKRGRGASPV